VSLQGGILDSFSLELERELDQLFIAQNKESTRYGELLVSELYSIQP